MQPLVNSSIGHSLLTREWVRRWRQPIKGEDDSQALVPCLEIVLDVTDISHVIFQTPSPLSSYPIHYCRCLTHRSIVDKRTKFAGTLKTTLLLEGDCFLDQSILHVCGQGFLISPNEYGRFIPFSGLA